MRRTMMLAAAAAMLTLGTVTPAMAEPGNGHVFTLAVYGDAPYGTSPTDTAEFQATPAFIDSINNDPQVSLVAHVGDIHSGKQYCTQAYDQSVYNLWTRYQKPLVYTPGDNEWTDCHKPAEGGGTYSPSTQQINYALDPVTHQPVDYASGNPVANLDLVRSTFFSKPGSTLGNGKQHVLSQAQVYDRAHPNDSKYIENVMWQEKGIQFVTLNIPGGSNNDADVWYGAPSQSAAQAKEVSERTAADLRWLDRAFAQAQEDHSTKGVVILTQADMWDLDSNTAAHLTGYNPFVASIASHTTQFGKPVLLFNGDSHQYKSDNPLSPSAPCVGEVAGGGEGACASVASAHPGYDVPNFHRVVVHGSTFPLEWLKLTIDTNANAPASANAFGPFSWQRMTQS
ncbi:metallophosphoesterase [Actinacidiphila soli]|uniref:metallophosphoesterase n=1 Tax=Actinacidiphila soli TaxID=2487275 RepID=UPI0013E2C9E6|nr:metallophosphoesterase [Actinacidiphila soli]